MTNKSTARVGKHLIKIEKNILIPSSYQPKDQAYPFAQMRQGDSFFIECFKKRDGTLLSGHEVNQRLRVACAQFVKRNPRASDWVFTCHKVREDKREGARIWRIA